MTPSLFNTLVPALLHTLWIGLVAAAMLFVALRQLPAQNARLRYALGLVALIAVFVGGLVAWELPSTQPQTSAEVVVLKNQTNPSDQPQPTAPASTPTPQASSIKSQSSTASPGWHQWLGVVWMAGAGISLLRLVRVSLGIQQLIRRSRAVECPVATRLLAELSRMAGTSRRVLLLTGEHVLQPAVAGIFRPVLLLPLSLLTGLPEWQLRAILAHELAHIVRHDFLVNALQLLAETLLFFNPAAGWINRRIREEREACCDALAAHWIDNHHELAETLINQATLQHSALPAFSDSSPDTLKSRILRLVNPSQQPNLKLPWKSLLLVALIATGGLLIAKKGTSEAIGYLKRLQTLELARDQFETPVQKILRESGSSLDKMFLELTIITEDGKPLPLPININCWSRGGSHGEGNWLTKNDITEQVSPDRATFRFQLDSLISEYGHVETFYLIATGYAQFSGTGGVADSNGVVRPSPVVLSKGYEGAVRFLDTQGKPILGVEANVVHAGSSFGDPAEADKRSDQNGELKVQHCSEHPFHLTLYPPDGFAYDQGRMVFKPNEIMEWKLRSASPFSGIVLEPNGLPVANARVRLFSSINSLGSIPGAPIEAQSDMNGRFTFSRMLPHEQYTLAIDAEGYFGKFIKSCSLDNSGKRFVLNPGGTLTVHLKNIDVLENRLYLGRSYTYESRDGGQYTSGAIPREWTMQISKTDTEATFVLFNIWEGKNRVGIEDVSYIYNAPSITNAVTLDIAQLKAQKRRDPKRIPVPHKLTLRLIPPKNEPMPSGVIKVEFRKGNSGDSKTYSIPADGIIRDELMINPNSGITVLADRISGYVISQSFKASKEKFDVDCQIQPAGGAALTVVDEDGNPVTHYNVSVDSKGGWFGYRGGDFRALRSGQTGEYTCMVNALDFESRFQIRVSKYRPKEAGGSLEYESGWFAVSKSRPVKKLRCVLRPVD